jgi:hypothetical protein
MTIHTGKLASNSTSFQKKIKEQDANIKASKVSSKKDKGITSKLLKDFPEIKTDNTSYKKRLVNISKMLTKYEDEISKLQFIDERVKEIEKLLIENNREKIKEIIVQSKYDKKPVLTEYFKNNDFDNELKALKKEMEAKNTELEKQFKTIEITSQNIISLYSYPMNINDNSIKNLDIQELSKTTQVNNKRVIDLIS